MFDLALPDRPTIRIVHDEENAMEPMSLLAWIVVGLIAGWLASQVVSSRWGLLGNTLIGMVGALLGAWIFRQSGEQGTTGLSVWSVLVAFVGAVILLLIFNEVGKRR